MLNTPYKGVLSNGFILSIAIAAIASIAIVARDNGALILRSEVKCPHRRLNASSRRPGRRVARNVYENGHGEGFVCPPLPTFPTRGESHESFEKSVESVRT